MLAVTEYFIHQVSEADWLTRARDSRCAEASITQPPLFVSVTLVCIKIAMGCTNIGVSHTQTTGLLFRKNTVLLSDKQEKLFYSNLSV
jgi:hypothetical protein